MAERDLEALDRRLRAVEQTLTEEPDAANAPERKDSTSALDERIADLESEVADLQAAVQALRGYVGNVRSVNRSVERRAERALAAVEDIDTDARTSGRGRPPTRNDPGSNAHGSAVDGQQEGPSQARGTDATRPTDLDDGARMTGDAPTHQEDSPGGVGPRVDDVAEPGDADARRSVECPDSDERSPSLDLPPGRESVRASGNDVGGSLDVDDPVGHGESPFDDGSEPESDALRRHERTDDGSASAGFLERVRNVL